MNIEIERPKDEVVIRVAAGTDLSGLQRLLDYIRFREISSKSKATQKQIDDLAQTSKAKGWEKNKTNFIK